MHAELMQIEEIEARNCYSAEMMELPTNLDFYRKLDNASWTRRKPSIKEPQELELKTLLSHLEYAFLADNLKLHMIIVSNLK